MQNKREGMNEMAGGMRKCNSCDSARERERVSMEERGIETMLSGQLIRKKGSGR